MNRILLLYVSIVLSTMLAAQTTSQVNTVQMYAMVQASPPSITLNWVPFSNSTGFTLYRKPYASSSWGSAISTMDGSAYNFVDNTVVANSLYEYKIVRNASAGSGYGYITTGIEVQPTDQMGTMILLVSDQIAPSLTSELQQLQKDLQADGWATIRHDVSPNATVVSVRDIVISDYNADPANVKAVYIIGHVPVPYSGNIAPDGHTSQHIGAWPCDGYYGDMNGTWTDNSVTSASTGWPDNRNNPGDGKFDQSDFPTPLELQVGRVDLSRMPAFASTEAQLTSAYLTKAHNFKTRSFTPLTRGIIFDHFSDYALPLASSGWKTMSPVIGSLNITEVPFNSATWLEDLINGQSYLWAYGCGGGTVLQEGNQLAFNGLDRIGHTAELANTVAWGGVFNMMWGSYCPDWNNQDNFLRAVLCSGAGLTNVGAGNPNWWFHPMGMGATIGSNALLSMNNVNVYTPQSGSYVTPDNRVAMGLMGDPSLRMLMVAPPTNLSVTNSGGNAAFTWNASGDAGAEYNVYAFNGSGSPVRLNANMIAGTGFTSAQPFVSGALYMVRAVTLQTTASGSYWNMSLGALATGSGTSAGLVLAPRVILEGAFDVNAGLMRDDLRTAGLIPLNEPYSTMGFPQFGGGGGETTTQGVLNTTGPDAIVDWVCVELRSANDPTVILATQQALLQRDGDVVSADGSPLQFNLTAGSYHVAIEHRNHLAVMTGNSASLSSNSTAVDFTSINTYGTQAEKTVGTLQAMWMGNVVRAGGAIKYTGSNNDRDPILARIDGDPTSLLSGYYPEDSNMNGVVEYAGSNNDRDPILSNVGGSTPNNVRVEQLP